MDMCPTNFFCFKTKWVPQGGVRDAKETACCKWVLVVTEHYNIEVNDFRVKKCMLVVSGTQCNTKMIFFS